MIVSFLLAAVAGFAVPFVEPPFRRALTGILKTDISLNDTETRILTLLLLLALSALLTASMGINTVSLATVLGGGIGYFGMRLYAFIRDPDGSDVPDDKRWDGQVRAPGEARRLDQSTDDADAETLQAVDAALREAAPQAPPPPSSAQDPKEPNR